MLERRTVLGGLFALVPLTAVRGTERNTAHWDRAGEIRRRIQRPHIPQRDYLLTDYGGRTGRDCTRAFTRAIAAAHAAGGGRVVLPAGRWLTGAIHLKSNVGLHLDAGAVVRFHTNPKAYLPLVESRWEGMALMNYAPLIHARDAENIAITGKGRFDGGADRNHWWPWRGKFRYGWRPGMPNQMAARKRLHQMCRDGVPLKKRIFGEGCYLRPAFFEPFGCKNVLIEGVQLDNMPFWQIHPVLCHNVTVRGLTVNSPDGPNTDGCDPESCRNVLIEDCLFHTGDDCIALKSGRNEDGRAQNVPVEDVVIRNCRMVSGHGAVAIGSEISGGAAHIYVENCTMNGADLDRGLLIKDNCARGGKIRHVHLRHITIGRVDKAAISINFHYGRGDKGRFVPVVDDLSITGLSCRHCHHPWVIRGLKSAPVGRIRLHNCRFRHREKSPVTEHAPKLRLSNVTIRHRQVQRA